MKHLVLSRSGAGSRATPVRHADGLIMDEWALLKKCKPADRYEITLEIRDFTKEEIATMEPFGGW